HEASIATVAGSRGSAPASTAASSPVFSVATGRGNALPGGLPVVVAAARLICDSVSSVAVRGWIALARSISTRTRCTGPQSPNPAAVLAQPSAGLLFQFASQPCAGLTE